VVFASSAVDHVDHVLESTLGQNKDCKITICCFSAKHAALRRKNKYWIGRNQENVSEWSDMSTCGLYFIVFVVTRSGLTDSVPFLISSKFTCSIHSCRSRYAPLYLCQRSFYKLFVKFSNSKKKCN